MKICGHVNPQNIKDLALEMLKNLKSNVVFLCVGNSNVVADCFGPLVGQILSEKGFKNVVGNLEFNVTAKNFELIKNQLKTINAQIVVIDATLSSVAEVGSIKYMPFGCIPASSVNTEIVGDLSILACVNVVGISGLSFLRTTKFNMVLNMANFVASAIECATKLFKNVDSLSNKV